MPRLNVLILNELAQFVLRVCILALCENYPLQITMSTRLLLFFFLCQFNIDTFMCMFTILTREVVCLLRE